MKLPADNLPAWETQSRIERAAPRRYARREPLAAHSSGAILEKANPSQGGAQSYGLFPVLVGRIEAARLPKGWTGPVRLLGKPALRKKGRLFSRLQGRVFAPGFPLDSSRPALQYWLVWITAKSNKVHCCHGPQAAYLGDFQPLHCHSFDGDFWSRVVATPSHTSMSKRILIRRRPSLK